MNDSVSLNREFLKLREKFIALSADRLAAIETAAEELANSPDPAIGRTALEAMKKLAHTVAGSSGTYGYPEVAGIARELEQRCRQALDAGSLSEGVALEEIAEAVAATVTATRRMIEHPENGRLPF